MASHRDKLWGTEKNSIFNDYTQKELTEKN